MRRTALVLLLLALTPAVLMAAESVTLVPGAAELSVRVVESEPGRTVIEYSVAGFSMDETVIDGEVYYTISLAGEGRSSERGLPALPDINRSIVIPDASRMTVRVLESDFVDHADTPVAPSRGTIYRNVDPATVPYVFDGFYESDAWYPSSLAGLGEPYIMRDHRGVVVTVNPFQYLPSTRTLRVYKRIVVEVVEAGVGRVNVLTARPLDASGEFEKIYERHFLNYEAAPAKRYAPVGETGNMLVICYDSFQTAMQPFVEWKKQMGVPCEMVSVTDAGGTATGIESYIQNYYDTEGLTYVLLVGDAAQAPTLRVGSNDESDPSYSLTAGSDVYPDLFVGRFSAESVADVETQVLRSIEYERDPQAAADWYHRGMGVASDQGPGDDGEYDDEHIDNIRTDLLGFTYTEVDQIYDPTGTAAMVSGGLNAGRSIINYTGHGSTTSWGSTGFSNTNVNALMNDNMLPFIVSVACVNGNFDGYTCFAEAWLRATNGGEPTGAAATYMSSINQSWDPPMVCQDEVNDLLVAEAKRTFGGLCYNGACQMIDEGGDGDDMFLTWHVFGDPSLRVRTDTPASASVTHSETIAHGEPSYDVNVAGVEGALCALYADGVLYGSAVTDAFGDAAVPFSQAPAQGDTLVLTVTGFNLDTYTADVPVASAATFEVVPSTIPVGSTTAVTVTVRDGDALPMPSVVVSVGGWGISNVSDTTDALGQAHFSLSPAYGETLSLVGRELGEDYDCFTTGIPVTGASTFASVDIDAGVASLSVLGHLVKNYEGTITGTCSETSFDVIAAGSGVNASGNSGGATTLDLQVTPTEAEVVQAVVAKAGFEVYEEAIDVEIVQGQLSGEVYESAYVRAAIEGASVRGYVAGADTSSVSPVFSAVSGADGAYTAGVALEAGEYDVYAARFGYIEGSEQLFVGQGLNDLDFYLDDAPHGAVSGNVTESGTGLPLAAVVKAYRTDNGQLYDETVADAGTGAYSLSLPYSTYSLGVSSTGHIATSVAVTVDGPAETVDVVLEQTLANILVLNDKDGRYEFIKYYPTGGVAGIAPSIGEERSADVFAADLVALGYDVTQEDAETSDPATWPSYDFIVSSSGDDTSPISDSAYRAALESYVLAGGKLLIEGGELGWVSDVSPGYPTFRDNVLHISDWEHDASGAVDIYDAGHALTTSPNVLGSMSVLYSGYGDHDSNTAAADADVVCDWASYSGLSSVLVYDDNEDPTTAQIVYYSFNFEAADALARASLLENTVTFLTAQEYGTGVDEGDPWVSGHFIGTPSPNPFNPVTRLNYGLASDAHVRIDVYNIAGRLVRTLVDGAREAGTHTATWDGVDDRGRPVASGVYLCRMEADNFTGAAKLVLLK